MSVITIQDFSGMMPLRDGMLLPDRNAQYVKNAWLYKGNIRGFRQGIPVYTTIYSDTQQVYRIPESTEEPPNFAASKWLEFPDPFISVIRNPVVGDQWNRYYFFPSDKYASTGANPDWPTTRPPAQYRTYDPATGTVGPLLTLGIPTPKDAPTVVPAPTSVTKTATAAAPSGSVSLTLNNTTDLSDGMSVTDASTTTVSHTTTARTGPATAQVSYPTVAPTNTSGAFSVTHTTATYNSAGNFGLTMTDVTGVTIGMTVTNTSTGQGPSIPAGTTVVSISGVIVGFNNALAFAVPNGNTIKFQSLPPNTLALSSTSGAIVGMGVVNLTNPASIPTGATIASIVGNDITLSVNVVSTVNIGDTIQCGNTGPNVLPMNDVTGVTIGMTITDTTNPTALIYGTTVTAVSGLNVTMSQNVASSGVSTGDTIKFENIAFP